MVLSIILSHLYLLNDSVFIVGVIHWYYLFFSCYPSAAVLMQSINQIFNYVMCYIVSRVLWKCRLYALAYHQQTALCKLSELFAYPQIVDSSSFAKKVLVLSIHRTKRSLNKVSFDKVSYVDVLLSYLC
jgi:hypothetical protein